MTPIINDGTYLGYVYFAFCSLIAVAGALSTVIARNPIRGAMGLLVMIVSLAGLFLALHAEFLAVIQLIVYAGAIIVLFLFVIMLLGASSTAPTDTRGRIPRTIGAAVFTAASLSLIAAIAVPSLSTKTYPKALADVVPKGFGGIKPISFQLFDKALVPFELASVLLMVAVVGAVAVARGKQPDHPTGTNNREGAH